MTPDNAASIYIDLKNYCGYVYCLTFPNGKKYVGQSTKQWKYRWAQHKSIKSGCSLLRHALTKYGSQNLVWEILGYAKSKPELNTLEASYINKLSTLAPSGYNLKSIEERTVYTDKTKEQIGVSNTITAALKKGIHLSREEALAQHKNKIHKSVDSNRKNSQAIDTGINVLSYITSLREANICLRASDYTYYIRSKDPVWSGELHKKLSDKARARGFIGCIRKPVICYETKEWFNCAPDVTRKYPHLSETKVYECCNERRKSTRGLHFYYANISEDKLQSLIQHWNSEKIQHCRKVQCLDTGIVYDSVKAAKRETGCYHIEAVCRGKRKVDHGLHWAYV